MIYRKGFVGFRFWFFAAVLLSIFVLIGIYPIFATENTNITPNTETTPNAATKSDAVPDPLVKQDNAQKTSGGNKELGQQKSQICVACHGVDGNSVVPAWPKIAGQLERYLIKELKEYRKGEKGARFDPTMSPMSQSLSDSDIEDLAAYFSKQTETIGNTKADLLTLGEKIYRAGNLETGVPACAACHGPAGMGNNPAIFPRLSGQFPEYTLDQLKKFRAKTRSDDPNSIMRDIANKMTDEEMQAVSSYVSGLH